MSARSPKVPPSQASQAERAEGQNSVGLRPLERPPSRPRGGSEPGALDKEDGTPVRKPRSPHRIITDCAARLKKAFGPFDSAAATGLARTLKAALVPRRKAGRKADASTVQAAEMYVAEIEAYRQDSRQLSRRRFEHQLWHRIYQTVIPEALTMHPAERMHQTDRLRRRVAAYLKRRKRSRAGGRKQGPARKPKYREAIERVTNARAVNM